MYNLEFRIWLGLVMLVVANSSFGQIHFSSKKKLYLLEDSLEFNIIQPSGRQVVCYKMREGHFINWSGDRTYPDSIHFNQFLIDHHFEKVGELIPIDEITYHTEVTDSTEDYVLPCSNADEPSWKQQYHYQFGLKYKKKLLYQGKGYTSGFGTTFNKQLDGLNWAFKTYTKVWKSTKEEGYYIHASDGFHILIGEKK